MSLYELDVVLDLCVVEGVREVSWQGGEPLLHPEIEEVVAKHLQRGISVNLFTNAVVALDAVKVALPVVRRCLVNYVNPETLSSKQLRLRDNNVQTLFDSNQVAGPMLGHTICAHDEDCRFFSAAIKRFGARLVRLDLARPSPDGRNEYVPLSSIRRTLRTLNTLADQCSPVPVVFDCCFPLCEIDKDQWEITKMRFLGRREMFSCSSVLTIGPGLTVGSCYSGLGQMDLEVGVLGSLRAGQHLIQLLEDKLRWGSPTFERCVSCDLNIRYLCQGGCLGFKNLSPIGKTTRVNILSLMEEIDSQQLVMWSRAEALLGERQYEDAYQAFGKLGNERIQEAHVGMATAAAYLGWSSQCAEHLAAAIEIDPTALLRYIGIAKVLATNGDNGTARLLAKAARTAYDNIRSLVP